MTANHVVRRYRAFVMVPVEVLDAIVDPVAIAVYLRIRQHADSTGEGAHPSRKRLAAQLGFVTPKPVDKAIGKLVELGLIDVFERWRDAEGNVAVARNERFNRQTSNGFIVYDEPGAGSGAEAVVAPPEVAEGVHLQRPPENVEGVPEHDPPGNVDGVAVRQPPGYPYGNPPGTRTGTRSRSLELDPREPDPPLPPAEESDGSAEGGPGNGEGANSNMEGPHAGADAPRGGYPRAVAIVTQWAEARAGSLTQAWRGKFVGHVSAALEAGHDPGVIERALVAWDDGTSLSPNRLPYLIEQEAERVRAARSSALSSRAEAEATARMLDERRARVKGKPGTVDTEEFMRRALSPEAWARREARLAERDGEEPPRQ